MSRRSPAASAKRPTTASSKTERLLNLVIALLYTRQPMSKGRIRTAVPQYADSSSEAFDRMFERDKDELRALGIPLRTEVIDPFFSDETGYRIDKREYALPEIHFAPDEMAVIGVASRAWSQASLAGPAAQALRKLEAGGLTRDEASVAGIEPLLHTSEPAFDAARDAVLARREVTFPYRRGAAGATTERQLQPWALTAWHGRWYLTGFDLDRQAPRVFRLDRVEGELTPRGAAGAYQVPEGHDPRAMITSSAEEPAPTVAARVALRPGAGHQLRRRGTVMVETGPQGWDVVELGVTSGNALADEIAGFGPDALALAPQELVADTRRTLEAVLAAHTAGGPGAVGAALRESEAGPAAAGEQQNHYEIPGSTSKTATKMGRGETATQRLSRLLTMVPWLLHRQGIDIGEAAEELGVSRDQIVEDLQLLFVCGTPGHYPDDLIAASWEGDRVHVDNAAEIARPLRLGRDEALALIVALRALAATPGIGAQDAMERALAKLEQAAGTESGTAGQVSVNLEVGDDEQALLGRIREALGSTRRVHLRHFNPVRDQTTERDVDPMRVVSLEGRWYLEGWCHRVQDVRLFRLDRIESLEVLDQDGTPPEQARPRDTGARAFQASPEDTLVTLELESPAAWVAESFPVESSERREDGSQVITLRAADPRWVSRLVWRLGGQARVLAPTEFATQVGEGARRALQGYRLD